MRALFAFFLLLSVPPRAWDYPCFVDEGHYQIEVRTPAVGAGWTYTAVPPVTVTTSTYYTVPISYTKIYTRIVPLPPPPHTETFTRTIHAHTSVYTDSVEPLGFAPRIVTDRDLSLRFTSPVPFTLYHCAPEVRAHTFIPLIHRPTVYAIAPGGPID